MSESERIKSYAKYNIWANQRIIDWLKNQPDEVLDATVNSSFPSLRKTFLHNWDAEQIWRLRLEGESPKVFPSTTFSGNTEALFDGILSESYQFYNFLLDKTDEWFDVNMKYQTIKSGICHATRADAAHHCFNHSTYHRGQLVTIARILGVFDPPPTDYMLWTNQK